MGWTANRSIGIAVHHRLPLPPDYRTDRLSTQIPYNNSLHQLPRAMALHTPTVSLSLAPLKWICLFTRLDSVKRICCCSLKLFNSDHISHKKISKGGLLFSSVGPLKLIQGCWLCSSSKMHHIFFCLNIGLRVYLDLYVQDFPKSTSKYFVISYYF